jgi:hypothetical protein
MRHAYNSNILHILAENTCLECQLLSLLNPGRYLLLLNPQKSTSENVQLRKNQTVCITKSFNFLQLKGIGTQPFMYYALADPFP